MGEIIQSDLNHLNGEIIFNFHYFPSKVGINLYYYCFIYKEKFS